MIRAERNATLRTSKSPNSDRARTSSESPMTKPLLFTVLSSGALLVSAALSQDAIYKGLTARELCLRPPVAAGAPAHKAAPKAKATAPKSEASAPVVEQSANRGTPEVKMVASHAAPAAVPLGMRYSLRKRIDGKYEEVSPDTVFHAGDRIQLHVETFDRGYLYIVQQGSSKRWEVLFPNSDTNAGDNQVSRNQVSKLQFYFDQQAGAERLFVVFSRKPLGELENLIYTLANDHKRTEPEPKQKVLVAQSRAGLDDQLVAGLRTNLVSRDLVFEKVDEDSGEKTDKAVYVAVPSRAPDARLVADVMLKHE